MGGNVEASYFQGRRRVGHIFCDTALFGERKRFTRAIVEPPTRAAPGTAQQASPLTGHVTGWKGTKEKRKKERTTNKRNQR